MTKNPASKYIEIRDMGLSESGKTRVWYVINKRHEDDIPGIIKWNGAWRKYVYHTTDAYYDWDCLRMIADFMHEKTKEHYGAVHIT